MTHSSFFYRAGFLLGLLALVAVRGAAAPARVPRLVDLGADTCVPCKLMMPVLAELKRDYAGQLEVVFIDVWKDRVRGREYALRVIPTQIFFDAAGREVFRHEGFMAKPDIVAQWAKLGVLLQAPAPGN